MKRLFGYAFIFGLLVAALVTTFWPLPQHLRYRSVITVPADGGRQEDFVIRWPEDRISRAGENREDIPAAASVGAAVLEDTAGNRVSAELFRLRDSEDNVIGVASRVAGTGGALADPGRSASNWLLVIPSRGALFLDQADARDMTVRQQATADGVIALPPAQSAVFWTDGPRFRVTAAARGSTGKVLRGTDEFDGLTGSFAETWELDEANPDSGTRGHIVLSTLLAAQN